MKKMITTLFMILASLYTDRTVDINNFIYDGFLKYSDRIEELNRYWTALAKSAKEGDFEGMKALYHKDAVVVKSDTTFAVSQAFKYRWKKEILEVKNGKRVNTLAFRFSKRIGDNMTAFEKGIYHYTSIEKASGKILGDSYVHFETLLVKVDGRWVASMEYQKMKATKDEWEKLGKSVPPSR